MRSCPVTQLRRLAWLGACIRGSRRPCRALTIGVEALRTGGQLELVDPAISRMATVDRQRHGLIETGGGHSTLHWLATLPEALMALLYP